MEVQKMGEGGHFETRPININSLTRIGETKEFSIKSMIIRR